MSRYKIRYFPKDEKQIKTYVGSLYNFIKRYEGAIFAGGVKLR